MAARTLVASVSLGVAVVALPLAAVGGLAGCSSTNGGGSSELARESATHRGVLRNDMVAIGGETTGWALRLDSGESVQVDVTGLAAPERYAGKRVVLRGPVTFRSYVESGSVPVINARSVRLAE